MHLILLFGIFLILPLIIMLGINEKYNFYIESSFFIIILQSTYSIFISKGKGTSLFKVYFIFTYIFFGIIPWLEYKFGITYWSAKFYPDEDRILLNIILILLNQIVFFLYKLFYNYYVKCNLNSERYNIEKRKRIKKLNSLSSLIIILFSLISLLITLYMKDFSILALLYRGLEANLINGISTSNVPSWASSFMGTSIRYFPIISLIYVFYYVEKSYVVKFFLIIITLFAVFPLGIPRFAAAALYIPLLLMFFSSFNRYQNFSLLILFGVVYLFPLFNQFRWYKEGREINANVDFSFFFEGHFDSYQSLLMALSENFISSGRQIMGAFLFYIPRSIWSDKPIGSGAEMAKQFNLSFENISANFYAEGYINFGIIGCFLFAFILSLFMAKFDFQMWNKNNQNFQIEFFRPFYLILLGYLFFIMRGDLMSSTSFFIAFLLPSFIIFLLLKLNQIKLKKVALYENNN